MSEDYLEEIEEIEDLVDKTYANLREAHRKSIELAEEMEDGLAARAKEHLAIIHAQLGDIKDYLRILKSRESP